MRTNRVWRLLPLAVLIAILTVSVCAWRNLVNRIPSTGSMIKQFKAHRPTLDQLRAMVETERDVTFVSPGEDPKQLPGHLPTNTERWQEYNALMKRADVNLGIELSADGHLYFWTSRVDGFLSGEMRGFAYCRQKPRPINSDLDRGPLPDRQDLQYQPITDNWYIVHDF
ncbi:MAG: hypothetical protein ABIV13_06060 [Fimbriimonadales bacterium]